MGTIPVINPREGGIIDQIVSLDCQWWFVSYPPPKKKKKSYFSLSISGELIEGKEWRNFGRKM